MSSHLDHFKKLCKDHEKGIAIGAGVITVGALLAGGAYAWHEHSEGKAQADSPVRLHIRVDSAKDLGNKSHDGEETCDPFCAMKTGHVTIKTEVANNTSHPKWEQEFEVGIVRGKNDELHVEVLDKDSFLHSSLGHAKVDLREIGSDESEVNLHLTGGKSPNHGHVHMTFWITGE